MKLLNVLLLPLVLGFATTGFSQSDNSGTMNVSSVDGDVTIWPNPFREDLNIKVRDLRSSNISIEVRNKNQEVAASYTGPFHIQHRMNLSSLPVGSYWVVISNDGRTVAKRAVRKY